MESDTETRTPDGGDELGAEGPRASDPASTAPGSTYRVHRLRDLSSRDRLLAFALACALLFAPVSSAIRLFNVWTPGSDDALIELRARDVGTPRTPLVGQPSTSSQYGKQERNAAHPGPIEFYLLAPAERLLGGGVGMLLTTALITGSAVLVAAWAVFRQVGRGAGLAVAGALAAVLWTSGARSMVDPLSSAVGRFPLLCSVVLLWCLVCGDVRLLALTCAALSFTLQQHLSIVPATIFVTAVAVVGLVVTAVRSGMLRDRYRRRELQRSALFAAIVGLVLWSPVLYEEITGSPGNLTRIVRYAGDNTRQDVGYTAALRQVGHALGLPPLLGRTNLSGSALLAPLGVMTTITVLIAIALLITGGLRWRRSRPRLSALVMIAGALAVGGILNGANVPDSNERDRIAFYHWAIILSFLELLILLLTLGPPVWRWIQARAPQRRLTLAAVGAPIALVVVLVPAIGNLLVTRADNRLPYMLPKSTFDALDRQIRVHRSEIVGPTLLLSNGDNAFTGMYEGVAARLDADGFDVVHQASWKGAVADGRLVNDRTVRSAIVLSIGLQGNDDRIPGRRIATADPAPDLDRDAFELLVRQAGSSPKVVIGERLRGYLDRRLRQNLARKGLSDTQKFLYSAEHRATLASLAQMKRAPQKILAQRSTLELLASEPMAEPKLSQRALRSVVRTFPARQGVEVLYTHVSAYLLSRQQLLQYTPRP